LLRAFYKLTVVSLILTAFTSFNFQFDYLNLWLQAVTYLYPHLVICQRAPPYNSKNAHKRHLFHNRRFEHSIQYRLSEPIHEKKNSTVLVLIMHFQTFVCIIVFTLCHGARSYLALCALAAQCISYESTSGFKIVWSANIWALKTKPLIKINSYFLHN
jgi:hypothetical protein